MQPSHASPNEPEPAPIDQATLDQFPHEHPGWTATLLPYGSPGRRWAADRHKPVDDEERRRGFALELFTETLDELRAAVAHERARQEPYLQAHTPRTGWDVTGTRSSTPPSGEARTGD